MINLKILNKKQIKEILALIKQQWNAEIDLNYAFLQDKNDKIFIINKEFAEIDLEKLRINSLGMYFAQKMIDGLRLSIEGSQLIGPKAQKNVLELDNKQTKQWLQGIDVEIKTELKNYVILKYKKDFLGTGKIKQNKILNYIPKSRRLKNSI
jgi:NOL1/NOP2/fmu family ribosome biogenesis protein